MNMEEIEEQFLREVIEEFLASQEPLPKPFEKVLYDNLWDMYDQ